MGNSNWVPVSRHDPCPKCKKISWCSFSSDGAILICRRIDDGSGFERVSSDGSAYWIYRLKESVSIPSDWIQKKAARLDACERNEIASTDELNSIYSSILQNLELKELHIKDLEERGFTNQSIEVNKYKSFTDQSRVRVGEIIGSEFGDALCAKVPGMYREHGETKWTIAGPNGLVIPVRDAFGKVQGLKVRRDNAVQGSKYLYVSSRRYGGPSSPAVAHVPLCDSNDNKTVRLTEGELKADFATQASGILTIGLPGVAGWKNAVAPLRHFGADRVRVAFDLDQNENRHVAYALENTVLGLLDEGFKVEVERWTN